MESTRSNSRPITPTRRRIDLTRGITIKTTRAFVCAALLVFSASAKATIIVDGEFLEITNRVSEPIVAFHGGRIRLNDGEIVAPAYVPGPDDETGIRHSASVVVADSTFEMFGHSFLTSTNSVPLFVNHGAKVRLADNSMIVASSASTDAIQNLQGAINTAIYLEDHASIIGNTSIDTNFFISGNARITGRMIGSGGHLSLTMSGGSIIGGVALTQGGRYSAKMSGGRIDNGFRFGGSTGIPIFTMSGGEIYGGFTSQGSFQEANIFGGSIHGGLEISFTRVPLSIWGGNFNTSADDWLLDTSNFSFDTDPTSRTVAIYGGKFGSLEAGLGIRLSGTAAIDVYGYDLNLTNGVLSGYLSDGNWISLPVFTSSDWLGSVNLFDVR